MSREKRRWVCVCCGVCVCVLVFVCVCVSLLLREKCSYTHAAIAADSHLCSNIGRDVLLEGGSAVDAAISALICTGLVNPQSMGLGGGAIFTIRDTSGKVKVISSRETVPNRFRRDLLKSCPKSFTFSTGPDWVGVPGEVRGYAEAHRLFGKLPWSRLFQPSIKLAREGFNMPEHLAMFLNHTLVKPLVINSPLCELFCHKNKTLLVAGETLKYPKLAETMETIAEQGAEAFYTGSIAHDLIQDLQHAGGSLSLEDLRRFEVRVDDALTVPLGDYDLHIPPLPAGGALISLILNIMHGFGVSPESLPDQHRALTLHHFIEAAKFANGQKRNIKDPKYNQQPVDYMTDKSFADWLRKMILDNSTHPASFYNISSSPDRHGTTHVSVLLADGSAVSVTSTINQAFGSTVFSPKTGIILNNELADFCGRADSISAGEQPPSSMAPIILHHKLHHNLLVIGGSGGSMITTAVAQAVMNRLWFRMSLKDAIDAKVVFVDSQNRVNFEQGFDQALKQQMKVLGHDVKDTRFSLNVVNAVEKHHNCLTAVSDTRKHGEAAGY